ncbi:MAG: toxin-antitoxin system YwqK family antitoxin [Burkholderiaceae bacterium]|jgi:antitoxin component YwqK of YwqJK toxin-antitoxin module
MPQNNAASVQTNDPLAVTAFSRYDDQQQLREKGHRSPQGVHGLVETFDAKGQLTARCLFEHGKRSGPSEYFQSGRPLLRQEMRNDLAHGQTTSFDTAGQVSSRLQYEEGVLHGPAEYFLQGQLIRRAQFRHGDLHGRAEDFSATNSLVQQADYEQGLLHGQRLLFWPSGALMQRQQFDKGLAKGPPEQFNEKGEPLNQTDSPDAQAQPSRLTRLLRGD